MKTKLIIGIASSLLFVGCASALNSGMYSNSDSTLKVETRTVNYLTDNNDMALYTFDKDTNNKSNCYNGCETKWPVFYTDINKLNLPMGIKTADFGTIKRDNGAMQTTYKSKPLYYFFKDSKAKDTNGDWAKGVWHLVELNK